MSGIHVSDEEAAENIRAFRVVRTALGLNIPSLCWGGVGADSQVSTDRGLVPLGAVSAGDRIRLDEGRWAKLIAVLQTPPPADTNGSYVRIPPGVFGGRASNANTIVGAAQGICIAGGDLLEDYCGAKEALVLAKDLVGWAGCRWIEDVDAPLVTLVFEEPARFTVNGLSVMGFEPNEDTLTALTPETRAQLRMAAPHLLYPGARAAYSCPLPRLRGAEVQRVLRSLSQFKNGGDARVSVLGSSRAG